MYIGYLKNTGGQVTCHSAESLVLEEAPVIFFMVAAEDEMLVNDALAAVKHVHDLSVSGVPDVGEQIIVVPAGFESRKCFYVYAYFSDPANPSWNNCFYIGKGKGDRWTKHIDERTKRGALVATTSKERKIDEWINGQRANPDHRLNTPEAVRSAAVRDGLVRKIAGWEGSFSEPCSYSAEHYMIKGFRNVYSLANDTGGNTRDGTLRLLARDQGLNMERESHKEIWQKTIKVFQASPYQPNPHQSRLQLLSNQHLSENLDTLLETLGLVPQNQINRALGDYPDVPSHLDVVYGGNDLSIFYVPVDARPFRIQIRLSRTDPDAAINVRPITDKKEEREKFKDFIKCKLGAHYAPDQIPFRVPGGATYFKPFALSGNDERNDKDIYFPLNPEERVTTSAVWMNDNEPPKMNLQEALKAFLEKTRHLTKMPVA